MRGTRYGGSARAPLLVPLGGCGVYVSHVLLLAGLVQRKRVRVERGYRTWTFQPTAARREGRERARRWSRIPCHRMSWRSPLHAKLTGRPKHVVISLPSTVGLPVGRPWATPRPRRSLLDSALGYTAPPMMVTGEHRILGEVEQERAHARWRARSGHQWQRIPGLV